MSESKSRNEAYLELLTHGLPAVRNLAQSEELDLCQIEADHLHNIPSLINEENELRHQYYIEKERELYLERLRQLGETAYLETMLIWYSRAWKALASIAEVELTD